MSCGLDPRANLDHAVAKIREAAGLGAQIVCLQELFRSQYFCREEDARLFDLAETIPGPSTDRLCPLAAELGRCHHRFAVREARHWFVSQHGGDHRCRWQAARALSQDAYSGRSALLREVLFHSGRSRLPRVRYEVRAHRDARLLGPVVSGSRASGRHSPARTFCSIRRRSAGIRRRRRSTARRSTMPGERRSGRTRSRMGFMSRR